mmetsp:Transcript_6303/g.20156  ORF Transcript_6303/g.20156 Transcript_6303/m.20156 type:complete len:292 (+) Transcript_6303:97-972(+)
MSSSMLCAPASPPPAIFWRTSGSSLSCRVEFSMSSLIMRKNSRKLMAPLPSSSYFANISSRSLPCSGTPHLSKRLVISRRSIMPELSSSTSWNSANMRCDRSCSDELPSLSTISRASLAFCFAILRCSSCFFFSASRAIFSASSIAFHISLLLTRPASPMSPSSFLANSMRSLIMRKKLLKLICPVPSGSYLANIVLWSLGPILTSSSLKRQSISSLSMSPDPSLSTLLKSSKSRVASASSLAPPSCSMILRASSVLTESLAFCFCSAKPWMRIATKRLSSIQLPSTIHAM